MVSARYRKTYEYCKFDSPVENGRMGQGLFIVFGFSKRGERKMEIAETWARCVVCKGRIVGKFEMAFDATIGPLIIGPGSRNQYRRVLKGYHCSNCKI